MPSDASIVSSPEPETSVDASLLPLKNRPNACGTRFAVRPRCATATGRTPRVSTCRVAMGEVVRGHVRTQGAGCIPLTRLGRAAGTKGVWDDRSRY